MVVVYNNSTVTWWSRILTRSKSMDTKAVHQAIETKLKEYQASLAFHRPVRIVIFITSCNEKKRGWNSFTPTMLLVPTFRVTWLCNSHQLLLTQYLLSALRITRLCNSHQLLLTQYLLSALRITRLCNSHQLLLTQCLLSTPRITPPASPIWSFYSLFSSYANYHYLHIRSPQTHIPLFFFSQRSNTDAMWVIYFITF